VKARALKSSRNLSSSSKNIKKFGSVQCALIRLYSNTELNNKGTIKSQENKKPAVLYEIYTNNIVCHHK